jgi:hypothetical protein
MPNIKINKYLPVAIIYFFFNSVFLPFGLLYTCLLSPLFVIWLYRYKSFNLIWFYFLATIPFVIIHFINGVEIISYLRSYILLFTAFVFGLTFYQFLHLTSTLGQLYRDIIIINFVFVLIAIVAFFIPGFNSIFWYKTIITNGVDSSSRLRLFTYEASYYAFILAPIVIFYYCRIIFTRINSKALVFIMVTLPLLLSLSFGVILALIISLILLFISDVKIIMRNQNFFKYLLVGVVCILAVLSFIIYIYTNNILFIRIENVFKGHDTSFSGRTFDSLYLGWKIAAQKSILFGAGPGQIKVLGIDLFNTFYKNIFTRDQIGIPNSIGDLLAQFGLIGVLLKLSLEVYFFFKTEVYSNLYRLWLFLFVFIYQFTGSFINNIAEYVIWILAFYPPLFIEFNKSAVIKSEPLIVPA